MKVRKSMQEILQELKVSESVKKNIVHWHTIEEKEAQSEDMPEELSEILKRALERRGVSRLYTHQKSSYERDSFGCVKRRKIETEERIEASNSILS